MVQERTREGSGSPASTPCDNRLPLLPLPLTLSFCLERISSIHSIGSTLESFTTRSSTSSQGHASQSQSKKRRRLTNTDDSIQSKATASPINQSIDPITGLKFKLGTRNSINSSRTSIQPITTTITTTTSSTSTHQFESHSNPESSVKLSSDSSDSDSDSDSGSEYSFHPSSSPIKPIGRNKRRKSNIPLQPIQTEEEKARNFRSESYRECCSKLDGVWEEIVSSCQEVRGGGRHWQVERKGKEKERQNSNGAETGDVIKGNGETNGHRRSRLPSLLEISSRSSAPLLDLHCSSSNPHPPTNHLQDYLERLQDIYNPLPTSALCHLLPIQAFDLMNRLLGNLRSEDVSIQKELDDLRILVSNRVLEKVVKMNWKFESSHLLKTILSSISNSNSNSTSTSSSTSPLTSSSTSPLTSISKSDSESFLLSTILPSGSEFYKSASTSSLDSSSNVSSFTSNLHQITPYMASFLWKQSLEFGIEKLDSNLEDEGTKEGWWLQFCGNLVLEGLERLGYRDLNPLDQESQDQEFELETLLEELDLENSVLQFLETVFRAMEEISVKSRQKQLVRFLERCLVGWLEVLIPIGMEDVGNRIYDRVSTFKSNFSRKIQVARTLLRKTNDRLTRLLETQSDLNRSSKRSLLGIGFLISMNDLLAGGTFEGHIDLKESLCGEDMKIDRLRRDSESFDLIRRLKRVADGLSSSEENQSDDEDLKQENSYFFQASSPTSSSVSPQPSSHASLTSTTSNSNSFSLSVSNYLNLLSNLSFSLKDEVFLLMLPSFQNSLPVFLLSTILGSWSIELEDLFLFRNQEQEKYLNSNSTLTQLPKEELLSLSSFLKTLQSEALLISVEIENSDPNAGSNGWENISKDHFIKDQTRGRPNLTQQFEEEKAIKERSEKRKRQLEKLLERAERKAIELGEMVDRNRQKGGEGDEGWRYEELIDAWVRKTPKERGRNGKMFKDRRGKEVSSREGEDQEEIGLTFVTPCRPSRRPKRVATSEPQPQISKQLQFQDEEDEDNSDGESRGGENQDQEINDFEVESESDEIRSDTSGPVEIQESSSPIHKSPITKIRKAAFSIASTQEEIELSASFSITKGEETRNDLDNHRGHRKISSPASSDSENEEEDDDDDELNLFKQDTPAPARVRKIPSRYGRSSLSSISQPSWNSTSITSNSASSSRATSPFFNGNASKGSSRKPLPVRNERNFFQPTFKSDGMVQKREEVEIREKMREEEDRRLEEAERRFRGGKRRR